MFLIQPIEAVTLALTVSLIAALFLKRECVSSDGACAYELNIS